MNREKEIYIIGGVTMKKFVKLLVMVMVIGTFVVGCGTDKKTADESATNAPTETAKGDESATKTPTETAKADEDTSLSDIKENGKLILGLDASFPPMGFKDENQNIVGFDIDLAKEVCKRMDIELELLPIDWDAKEQELSAKNIDCIWNGLSYSEERAKTMTLSETYMKNTQVAVVLADSKVKTLEDLAGQIVVIQSGSTASLAVDANAKFKDSLKELVKVDDNVQALFDLKISGSDAVVMDEVVARYSISKEADAYKILETALSDEEYVIGFRKGDEALCQEIEKHLKEMAADGTLAKISTTWFGQDSTTIK